MRTPSAAAAAASAAAVAAVGRPDNWRPRRGTFPRPAAREAHRQRCRRNLACGQANQGARGRGGAAADSGLVSRPGLPTCPPPALRRPRRLLPPSGRPGGAPAEPTHRRRAGAGGRGRPGVRLGLGLAPAPLLKLPIRGARSRIGRGKGALLPGATAPPPPPRPPPPLPRLPGPWEGAQRGKGMVEFNRRQSVSRTGVCGTRAVERGEAPLQLTPPCPPRRPSPRFPLSQHGSEPP